MGQTDADDRKQRIERNHQNAQLRIQRLLQNWGTKTIGFLSWESEKIYWWHKWVDIPVSFNATVQYVIYCFDIERFAKLLNCSKSGIIIVCPFHSQCFQYSYMSVRLPKAQSYSSYIYSQRMRSVYLSRIGNEFLYKMWLSSALIFKKHKQWGIQGWIRQDTRSLRRSGDRPFWCPG